MKITGLLSALCQFFCFPSNDTHHTWQFSFTRLRRLLGSLVTALTKPVCWCKSFFHLCWSIWHGSRPADNQTFLESCIPLQKWAEFSSQHAKRPACPRAYLHHQQTASPPTRWNLFWRRKPYLNMSLNSHLSQPDQSLGTSIMIIKHTHTHKKKSMITGSRTYLLIMLVRKIADKFYKLGNALAVFACFPAFPCIGYTPSFSFRNTTAGLKFHLVTQVLNFPHLWLRKGSNLGPRDKMLITKGWILWWVLGPFRWTQTSAAC